jgi:hypothetical protein
METLTAVATWDMPLDVFADWLEDRDHPWYSFVRALSQRQEAYYEARWPMKAPERQRPHEERYTLEESRKLKLTYPFARPVGWELVARDREYYLTLYATNSMLLNYVCEIVRSLQPGQWHRMTQAHVPYLVRFNTP